MKAPHQPNQSLIDGLAVIEMLAAQKEPVSCTELAKYLNMEKTRANRLLKTLAFLGIAYQTENRKYSAGGGMHVLAAQSMFGSGLIRRALPVLENLHQYNTVVALGVCWQTSVSYFYHHSPGMSIADSLGRVNLFPASISSIGRAILASLSNEKIESLYEGKEITGFKTMSDFLEEIEKTRERGYALVKDRDDAKNNIGVAVGKPVYAAVALSGNIEDEEIQKYVDILSEASIQITKNA